MNKLFFLIAVTALITTGCSTAPVVAKFPGVPEKLLEKCPQLQTIELGDTSIVDLTKIVTKNYTAYYECGTKLEGWIEWYNSQKKIFDEVSE
jgi:hypothetical protein